MNISYDFQFNEDENIDTWLERGNRIKFVIVNYNGLIAHLFIHQTHASKVDELLYESKQASANQPKFLGAGHFQKDCNPKWHSDSCYDKFGYDQPHENADQIIATLKTELQKIFFTDRV